MLFAVAIFAATTFATTTFVATTFAVAIFVRCERVCVVFRLPDVTLWFHHDREFSALSCCNVVVPLWFSPAVLPLCSSTLCPDVLMVTCTASSGVGYLLWRLRLTLAPLWPRIFCFVLMCRVFLLEPHSGSLPQWPRLNSTLCSDVLNGLRC